MRCVYQIHVMQWVYDGHPYMAGDKVITERTCQRFCWLSFGAEIPCALHGGDEVDGLPGLPATVVETCTWSHRDSLLIVKLENEDVEFPERFKESIKELVGAGWQVICNSEDKTRGS